MVLGNNCGHCRKFKHNDLEKSIDGFRIKKGEAEHFDIPGLRAALQSRSIPSQHIDRIVKLLESGGFDNNPRLESLTEKYSSGPSEMSKLISALQKDGRVRIQSLMIDDIRNVSLGNEYHPELRSKIAWFPLFLIISAESWDPSGFDKPISASIMGAVYNPDGSLNMNASGVNPISALIMAEYQKEIPTFSHNQSLLERSPFSRNEKYPRSSSHRPGGRLDADQKKAPIKSSSLPPYLLPTRNTESRRKPGSGYEVGNIAFTPFPAEITDVSSNSLYNPSFSKIQ